MENVVDTESVLALTTEINDIVVKHVTGMINKSFVDYTQLARNVNHIKSMPLFLELFDKCKQLDDENRILKQQLKTTKPKKQSKWLLLLSCHSSRNTPRAMFSTMFHVKN